MASTHGMGALATGGIQVLLKRLQAWLGRPEPVAVTDTGEGARITFFGGKGGVGKTTCAAAYAVGQAGMGHRVLLVSTDPAHSLSDLLEQSLTMKPRQVAERLYAMELSPSESLRRYLGEVKENLQALASPELRQAAAKQAELAMQAPGAEDAALFDEMVRLVLDGNRDYQEIVFDTAPTGHTLQLLNLPEVMGTWADGLLARRTETADHWPDRAGQTEMPEDRAASILRKRRDRFVAMRDYLRDGARTRFIPVLNPDTLSREETGRMVKALRSQSITVDSLVINRVLPESAVSGESPFWQQRKATEAEHLLAIERDFHDLQRVIVPLEAGEIQGLAALKQLSVLLPIPRRSIGSQ